MRLLSLYALAAGLAAQDAPLRAGPGFNREVRPILAEHCFPCHGPDARARKAELRLDSREGVLHGGKSGQPAVVPGDPDASLLMAKVAHADPSKRMPPLKTGKPLSSAQVGTLRRWIAAGAEFEPHWSFVAPRRPGLPAVREAAWPRHAIDTFVLARMERAGLAPSAPADPATLLRRVTLDLTGLPPTPAELDAFLADPSDAAYAATVDRLLASSASAEHLARHWLDAARYGDTHGLHLDNFRSMWPYRDWVVGAFQRNLPFDQFVVEQLAGDLLPQPTQAQRIATGFHRCNPTSAEGGMIAEEFLALYAAERVATTGTVFLGLTVGCARCHDHKYDPITQREFYRLFAFFDNVAEDASDGNAAAPPPIVRVTTDDDEAKLARFAADVQAVEARLTEPAPDVDAQQVEWEAKVRAEVATLWQPLAVRLAFAHGSDATILADGTVAFRGANPARDEYELVVAPEASELRALRVEALLDGDVGPGRAPNGNFVLTGFEVHARAPGTDHPGVRVPLAAATADYVQRDFEPAFALDGGAARGFAVQGPRVARAFVAAFREPLATPAGTTVHVRLRFQSVFPQHGMARVRLLGASTQAALPTVWSPWSVSGPHAATSYRAAYDTAFPAESTNEGFTPRPEFTDGKAHDLPGGIAATYLRRTLTVPSARPVELALGSDDGLKVWLDGALVLDRDVQRPVGPDQELLPLWLEPGEHTLLLKVVNAGGGFAFYFRVAGEETQPAPLSVVAALTAEQRTPAQATELRTFYRRHHWSGFRALEQRRDALRAEQTAFDAALPRTLVMAERTERRPTHLLERGQYDRKGERVEPGVPSILPPLPAGAPPSRLSLARWLVASDHPLTARVAVNRYWRMLFGTGIVKTVEDFGTQGEWPSHPDLLDWLACEFIASGWDVRALLRSMVTSSTYRQASSVTDALLAADRGNRLLARASRPRLDAEVIRDCALATSGLLVRTLGGPPVKPYQPSGIWKAVAYVGSNTENYEQEHGTALYRRSLYTFWKRTAPPPTMVIFDAPSREDCTVRRSRTNTPLQALALLNDPTFVEAARALAARTLRAADDIDARLDFACRTVLARTPDAHERAALFALLSAQRAEFAADPAAATALLAVGESPRDAELAADEHAAWTLLCSTLLNLDEAITRN